MPYVGAEWPLERNWIPEELGTVDTLVFSVAVKY